MNREQRRQAERQARRGTRSSSQHSDPKNITHNQVAQALARARIMREVQSLRTHAGVHAFTGNDGILIADRVGRLLYTVAHAARLHNLEHTPEASILRGTANALADIAATPAALEAKRASILSGLSAIERLLPHLHEYSLAAGALELDSILMARDFMTSDVERALGLREEAAAC